MSPVAYIAIKAMTSLVLGLGSVVHLRPSNQTARLRRRLRAGEAAAKTAGNKCIARRLRGMRGG
jgi:hypothetical protein